MNTILDLAALRGASLADAAAALGADPTRREPVTGYQGLADLEVIDAPDGTRVFVRGDAVALIYVGPHALPAGLDAAALSEAVGMSGEPLRSRQGKNATLHVAAEQGFAWSEEDGELGFVEVFPPMPLAAYRQQIYREPPLFAQ